MLTSVTRFLEQVDQKAADMASEREALAAQAGRKPPVSGTAATTVDTAALQLQHTRSHSASSRHSDGSSGASPQGVSAATAAGLPLPQPLTTSCATEPADPLQQHQQPPSITEEQFFKRDQALLRMQRDYEEVAMRTREIAHALEAKSAEVEELTSTLRTSESDRAALREQLADRSGRLQDAEDEARGLRAAVEAANTHMEALRQEAEVQRATAQQAELHQRNATEALTSYKQRSNVALAERDAQLQRLQETVAGASFEEATASTVSAAEALLRQQLHDAHADIDRLTAEATATRQRLDVVAAAASKAEHRVSLLTEEAKSAQAMYEGEVAAHQASRARLEARLADASEEERLLRKRLTAAEVGSSRGLAASSSTALSSASAAGGATGGEWEQRAKELAELVLEKQAAAEARGAEAQQWRARFEAAQQRVREMELVSLSSASGSGGPPGAHRIRISRADGADGADGGNNDASGAAAGEFARSRFFGKLSQRGRLGRQLTSAAQQIDGLSLHAGQALRRSSVLRVAVLVYVIVLQLWAFFAVSLSSVPETPLPNQPKP